MMVCGGGLVRGALTQFNRGEIGLGVTKGTRG